MKAENTKLTFNNSERVTVDGNLVTSIPDGYKYAKDGYGGNQHWFYIVPDNYSLELDHIEAKPMSFGIVDLPVDISSTVSKDSIEGCKQFLIQNNALDPSVAIYDLICSEHCFFIFQRWFDSSDNLYNKINGFIFAKDKMYQFHTFMNHDKPVSDNLDVIRNFDVVSRQWMKHVALLGDTSYKVKRDPDEVKATLDDLSRMFIMAKEKMLPTLSDDLGSILRKTYALIAGMFYIKNDMEITPTRAQSVSNMVGLINGQEVSKDYLLNLISENGGKTRSITDVIQGFDHDRVFKALVTMDKISNAGFEGGLAMVHFVGVQILLKTLCADNKVDYDVDAFSLECIESLRTLFSEKWNETDAYMMNDSTLVIHQHDDGSGYVNISSNDSISDDLNNSITDVIEMVDDMRNLIASQDMKVQGLMEYFDKMEEREKKEKAERKKKKQLAASTEKSETDKTNLFVVVCNEAKLNAKGMTASKFNRLYGDFFPAYTKDELWAARKEMLSAIKDEDRRKYYFEDFRKKSFEDRFDIATRSLFVRGINDNHDSVRSSKQALDISSEWFTADEMASVEKMLKNELMQLNNRITEQFSWAEKDWMDYSTAKKYLEIVIYYYEDARDIMHDDCKMFQVKKLYSIGYLFFAVVLRQKGLMPLVVPVMDHASYYWGVPQSVIWKDAFNNNVRTLYKYLNDEDAPDYAKEAMRIASNDYPDA